jgi:hypothetical protein
MAVWIHAFEIIRALMALPELPRGKIGYIENPRPSIEIEIKSQVIQKG